MKSLGHVFFSCFYAFTLLGRFSNNFSSSLRIQVLSKPENTFLTIHSCSWVFPMQPDWNVLLIFWVSWLPNIFLKGHSLYWEFSTEWKIDCIWFLHSHTLKAEWRAKLSSLNLKITMSRLNYRHDEEMHLIQMKHVCAS